MEELWKDIKGYEGYYQASNTGKIRSMTRIVYGKDGSKQTKRGCVLKIKHNKYGYCIVNLWKDNKPKTVRVNRIIAETFIPNPNNYPQCNHKDEDLDNNCVENLEWCDASYNVNYGTRNDRVSEKLKIKRAA